MAKNIYRLLSIDDMVTSGLRWLAVALLLVAGVIHVVYGAYYVGGASSSGGRASRSRSR